MEGDNLQIQPPLTNQEINSLFVDTLPSLYYEKLVGNVFQSYQICFFSMEIIEYGIKRGKIMDHRAITLEKKRYF